jgi:hypothetical protein
MQSSMRLIFLIACCWSTCSGNLAIPLPQCLPGSASSSGLQADLLRSCGTNAAELCVISVSSEPYYEYLESYATDNDPQTFYQSRTRYPDQNYPVDWFRIDLGVSRDIASISVTPSQVDTSTGPFPGPFTKSVSPSQTSLFSQVGAWSSKWATMERVTRQLPRVVSLSGTRSGLQKKTSMFHK